jgi:hypothetical protein
LVLMGGMDMPAEATTRKGADEASITRNGPGSEKQSISYHLFSCKDVALVSTFDLWTLAAYSIGAYASLTK